MHRLPRITAWLDHVVELGLSGIALGPVFASETHGYDTVDHFAVDPRLGTEEDLLALVAAAHERGLRVTLDGVFNHVGRGFGAFQDVLRDGPGPADRWFRLQWQDHAPPFYCSVDLRNAGFKLAPVDTNLFPGGFNNLSEDMLPLAVQAAQAAIAKYCPSASSLLLIPENHTRNTFYLQNVARLRAILRQTGLDVRLGTLNPEVAEPVALELPDGQMLTVEPLVRSGPRVGLRDFDPCSVLLNNDLSAGLPAVLAGTLPTASGWGTVRSVTAPDAEDLLRDLVSGLGVPVVVHCCAGKPPLRLLAATGVAGIGVDATLPVFSGPTAVPAALDALGEVWDAGIPLLLGLVPAVPRRRAAEPGHEPRAEAVDADPADLGPDGPATGSVLRALARRAFDLADRLGFDRSRLADLAVPTPTCGLAGATPEWARRAMTLSST